MTSHLGELREVRATDQAIRQAGPAAASIGSTP